MALADVIRVFVLMMLFFIVPESAGFFFYFLSFYAAVLNNTVNLMQTVSFFKKVNSPILLPVQKV